MASLPALPLGKGALILIVGGIFAASISLVWTLMMPRETSMRASAQISWPHTQRHAGTARPVPMRHRQRVSGRAAAQPRPRAPPRARGRRGRARFPAGIAWLGQVSMVTEQRGLGEVEPVAVWDDDHCQVRLTECRSCKGGGTTGGCEAERQIIEGEVERYVAHPHVVEVDCQAQDGGSCVFDVRTVEAEAT